MSESIRQSNLFAGEDYKKVFKAYQFIDYTAYDFGTLKQALLNSGTICPSLNHPKLPPL